MVSGGSRPGADYEHRIELSIDTDLDKPLGWKDATTHATHYQIDVLPDRSRQRPAGGRICRQHRGPEQYRGGAGDAAVHGLVPARPAPTRMIRVQLCRLNRRTRKACRQQPGWSRELCPCGGLAWVPPGRIRQPAAIIRTLSYLDQTRRP